MRKSCCGVADSDLGALRLMDIMLKYGVKIVSVSPEFIDGFPKFSVFGVMESEDQETQIIQELHACPDNLKLIVRI